MTLMVILFIAWMIAQDVTYGLKGQPPPRKQVRLAEIKAGIAPPTYGFGGYWRDLKDDALQAETARRRRKAEEKAQQPPAVNPEQATPTTPTTRIDGVAGPGPAVNAVDTGQPAPVVAPAPPNVATQQWNAQFGSHLDDLPPAAGDRPRRPSPRPRERGNEQPTARIIPMFTAPTPKSPAAQPITCADTNTTNGGTMTAPTATAAPSAEITGLQSGINYADAMAEAITAQSANVEQYVASLRTGGVADGESITAAMGAKESLQIAAAKWKTCADELRRQLVVKEAYQAVPEAGDKTFVMAE